MITRDDWQNLKHFINPPFNSPCHLELTEDAMHHLKQGHRPIDMDDKWFSYCESTTLYIHRSWTGHLMFRAHITGLCITSVDIAMDNFVNLSTEAKIEVFHHVIDFLTVHNDQ